MSELVPAPAPFADRPTGGGALRPFFDQATEFMANPLVRRSVPYAAGAGVLGLAALLWMAMSSAPQRVLYPELSDSDKAAVTDALDTASIAYNLDPATGSVTVGEDDIYRARMVVASNGAVAPPDSGTDLMDSMPIGASRSVEAERLRTARERELQLSIMEIDGIEAVRVHLATAEKSVFVRENSPPRASVMLKMGRSSQLSHSQVRAITNLVAGSVPGLSVDDIKIIDQRGQLLSDTQATEGANARLDMQTQMEEKLRSQLAQLLTPMFGDGNFSTEVQVELDMDAVTSANESYDPAGVVRSETTRQSQSSDANSGYGVPGALSNAPPPPAQLVPGAPQGTAEQPGAQPVLGDQSATRSYDVGRRVAVINSSPGGIRRLSVAVVLSSTTGARKAADLAQIKALVGAAVGANLQRGDQVEVIARKFQPQTVSIIPFYLEHWFMPLVRNSLALLAVLLVVIFGLRPLVAAIRKPREATLDEPASPREPGDLTSQLQALPLSDQVGLAKRCIEDRPDSAVAAIRQLLDESQDKKAEAA